MYVTRDLNTRPNDRDTQANVIIRAFEKKSAKIHATCDQIRFPRLVSVGMERRVVVGGVADGRPTPVDSLVVFLSDRWFVHLDVFRPYADTGERQR